MYKNIMLTILVILSGTNLYINTIEPRIKQHNKDSIQTVPFNAQIAQYPL